MGKIQAKFEMPNICHFCKYVPLIMLKICIGFCKIVIFKIDICCFGALTHVQYIRHSMNIKPSFKQMK